MRVLAIKLLVVATAVIAGSCMVRADSPEEADQNQRLLEKWREDPAHYSWLKQGLQAFLSLPAERQEQMRVLDRALRDEDSATSVRLMRVMERYSEWLQRLPEADRKRVEAAPNAKQRLQIVKELREREWIDRLPLTTRQELEKLTPDARRTRIAEIKKAELAFNNSWRTASRQWDELITQRPPDAILKQFEPEIRALVTQHLLPLLNAEEKKRLQDSRDKYPLFLETMVELTDKHLVRLPGPAKGPTRFSELPAKVREQVPELRTKTPPVMRNVRERWPDYCIAVNNYANNHKTKLNPQLGPCRPSEFSPEIKEFIAKKLLPVLDPDEKNRLTTAEGRWPAYPRVLADVAFRHQFRVPGTGLPGPSRLWDPYRKRTASADAEPLPGVSDATLLDFMRNGLTAEERGNLPSVALSDPATISQLRQLYFQKNPDELQRLRQQDRRKQLKKAPQK
jgi:hypothetical protein